MDFWTLDNLRDVTGGRILHRPTDAFGPPRITGVSTDSRSIADGQVFCALRGEKFDGHNYLRQALDAGASVLMIDREQAAASLDLDATAVLLVGDTLAALAKLAAAYRRQFAAKVIAITGSVGKTTAKQIVHAMLSARFTGRCSPKSFNNAIGVPLTLLSVEPTDQFVVVEVGSNAPGEIGALSRIVEPDIAVITTIGRAHLEGFGDLAGVAKEKASMLSHLRDGGMAILNGDCPELVPYHKLTKSIVTFGRGEGCDLRLTDVRADAAGVSFTVNGRATFHLPLLGAHNAMNGLAAVAVGRVMQLTDERINAGFRRAVAAAMRLNIKRLTRPDGELTLINDAYNANPDSMAAALGVLGDMPVPPPARRIAVLGDMAELGSAAPDLHRELGRRIAQSDVDHAVLIGPMCLFAAELLSRDWPAERVHLHHAYNADAENAVIELLRPGDAVLVKASRSMGFERLIEAIEKRWIGYSHCGT